MKFCPNCGAEVKCNEEFCTNCGFQIRDKSKLEKYEIENILKSVHKYTKHEIIKEYIIEIKDIFIGMLIKPFNILRSISQKPLNNISIVILLMISVLNGIGGLIALKLSNHGIKQSLYIMCTMYRLQPSKIVNLSYIKGFILAFGIVSIEVILTLVLLVLINRIILKKDSRVNLIWSMLICTFIPFVIFNIISILLDCLVSSISLIFIVIAIVSYLVCLFTATKYSLKTTDNISLIITCCICVFQSIVLNLFLTQFVSII